MKAKARRRKTIARSRRKVPATTMPTRYAGRNRFTSASFGDGSQSKHADEHELDRPRSSDHHSL